MATTIVTKKGSGAPAASDLVEGELAVDTTNGRLYTENSSAAVVELGSNPSGNITFGDNGKAIFGAGSDLQIYHDGTDSYITEVGNGNLIVKAAGGTLFQGATAGESLLTLLENGAVTAYYDNAAKLATTATGIDVTGSVTADGLTVEGASAGGTYITSSSGPAGGDIKIEHIVNSSRSLNTINSESGINSAIPLALATGGVERMRIDASGNLGLGITPSAWGSLWKASEIGLGAGFGGRTNGTQADVYENLYRDATNVYKYKTSAAASVYTQVVGNFIWSNAGVGTGGATATLTERMRIDSSGNVGIGTSSPLSLLDIRSVNPKLTISSSLGGTFSGATTIGELAFHTRDGSGIGPRDIAFIQAESTVSSTTPSADLVFGVSASNQAAFEAMRLDYSGNLLVGTTDTAPGVLDTNTGVSLNSSGTIFASRNGDYVLNLNRNSSDGDIVRFRKDGAQVGSIGVKQSDAATGDGELYVASGNTGLFFDDLASPSNYIRPCNASGGLRDNIVDLGKSDSRFKDLYLSGGVYLGGTGAANKLDDYEEGTFTPTFVITNCTVTHDIQQGNYTKVGNTVFFHLVIGTDAATGSFSGSNVLITGMPFAASRSLTGAVGLAHSWASELDDPSWSISTGTTVMSFYKSDNAAGLVVGAQFATGGNSNRLDITGSYHTDS